MTPQQVLDKSLNEFVEKGANLEHDRWARWHLYRSHLMATPSNMEMWDRKAKTPYIALTNEEQESDRKETRNYLPLLANIITAFIEAEIAYLESKKQAESIPIDEEHKVFMRGVNETIQSQITHLKELKIKT